MGKSRISGDQKTGEKARTGDRETEGQGDAEIRKEYLKRELKLQNLSTSNLKIQIKYPIHSK
jgi:hypothetical protein